MTLTAIYFTGRAARRASNTAIDFTHVATNNHALPYGLSEPIAITNIKKCNARATADARTTRGIGAGPSC